MGNIKNNIQTIKSLRLSLKIKIDGLIKSEIQNKLNPNVPIIDIMLNNSGWLEKLKAIKFHGKPVKIYPLKNSIIPNNKEKRKNELTIFLNFKILNRYVAIP